MYEPIPESGGPFGGRNQALAVLCGMYRSKRVPFDVALPVIQQWNRDYCQPPLPEREVHNLVGRAWVQWAEGKGSDMTPEEARGETVPIEFLTLSDMERVEKEIELVPEVKVLLDFVKSSERGILMGRTLSGNDPE